MNYPQISQLQAIALLFATLLLSNPGIAKEQSKAHIILDQSYSLTPNVVRQTEVWEEPEQLILVAIEHYCLGHPNYGKSRYKFLHPPSQGWSDLQKIHPQSQMKRSRDLACQFLTEGKFELKNAEAYSTLAYTLREYGRLGESSEVLSKAIELYPDRAYLYNNLGRILWLRHDFAEAIITYRQGIELTSNPKLLSILYVGLGNALDDSGNFEDAVDAYHRAIELESDNAIPHFDLAIAFYRQGKFEQAIQECELAIQLDPNYNAPKELLKEIQQKQSLP